MMRFLIDSFDDMFYVIKLLISEQIITDGGVAYFADKEYT
jgi:hypothetical protein